MLLPVASRRWFAGALAVVVCVASACGTAGLTREDAIVSLQSTGVTEVEATCMADTLVALESLDAADPQRSLDEAAREALVSASTHCIRPQVLRASQSAPPAAPSQPVASIETSTADPPPGAANPETAVDRRSAAIALLMQFGRSFENATCVVDHLLAADGDAVFEDPNFGMGTDPFEAQAFASCI